MAVVSGDGSEIILLGGDEATSPLNQLTGTIDGGRSVGIAS
jgi:hypothetical protein